MVSRAGQIRKQGAQPLERRRTQCLGLWVVVGVVLSPGPGVQSFSRHQLNLNPTSRQRIFLWGAGRGKERVWHIKEEETCKLSMAVRFRGRKCDLQTRRVRRRLRLLLIYALVAVVAPTESESSGEEGVVHRGGSEPKYYLAIGAVFRDEDIYLAEWLEFHSETSVP